MNGLALCAGIGGLELGLHIALGEQYKTVCYVEREAYAASVVVARMEEKTLDTAPIWDSLETFNGKPWRGVVDIVSAGEPCQPFSVAGQRQGKSDERYLWPHVERIIREVEPEFVFLENVAGAVDVRYEHKAVLEGMGYRVEAGLFSAEEVGAPHQRVRVFMLAHYPGRRQSTWVERQQMPARGHGGELAHDDKRGCGGFSSGRIRHDDAARRDNADGCLPNFPPGPSDLDSWRRILAERPELEPAVDDSEVGSMWFDGDNKRQTLGDGDSSSKPSQNRDQGKETQPALCGVADGSTFRVERLSCLGNAVVPVVAALAFVTLWRRLRNDKAIEVAPYKSGP